LAVDGLMDVAEIFKSAARKKLIGNLGLLQAQDVRLVRPQERRTRLARSGLS
jgi:hypothetical protein